MTDIPDVSARLKEQLDNLERRVYVLEHPNADPTPAPELSVETINVHPLPEAEEYSFAKASGIIPMLGKSLLGIAGAYLLRAVAESGSVPKQAVVVLAIAYAVMWLVLAVRVHTMAWYTGITYTTTSGLILAPMLWELTLRFKVLPPSVTAVVLATYAMLALALSWRRSLVSVFWVAYSVAVFTALALMIVTHDLVPFLAALLLIGLASEFAAYRGHRLNGRILAGVIADIALLLLVFMYSSPANARLEYTSVANPILLTMVFIAFLIYAVSVIVHTLVLRHEITIFEITQAMITCAVAIIGVITFCSGRHDVAIGITCLVLSVATYAAAFLRFDSPLFPRNYHVYNSWSAALFLLGSLFCLPQAGLSLWLGLAAVAAIFFGAQRGRLTLEYHGAIYLAVAAYVSGLLSFTSQSLVGAMSAKPTWLLATVSIAALIGYVAGGRHLKDRWTQWIPHLVITALAVSAAAAFLVYVLARYTVHFYSPIISPLEIIQTLAICSVSLALAYTGSRWSRRQLTWIAYAMLLLIVGKLIFVDLRHGHFVLIAVSFFFFAATLILLPQLVASSQKINTAAEALPKV